MLLKNINLLAVQRVQRYWTTVLALCCCLLPASPTLSQSVSHARIHNEPLPAILVLGDSLSAAHGIDAKTGWVTLLDEYISSKSAKPYRVINASISGETTGGGLNRLPALLDKYQPAIVIIELGGNDGLRGFPITRLRKNLKQLVSLSQQAGAEVLLAGMRVPPNLGQRYTQQFYDSYVELAEQQGIALIPFLLEGVATQPELMQSDGIHPTAEAQPLILQNVLPYLKKIL